MIVVHKCIFFLSKRSFVVSNHQNRYDHHADDSHSRPGREHEHSLLTALHHRWLDDMRHQGRAWRQPAGSENHKQKDDVEKSKAAEVDPQHGLHFTDHDLYIPSNDQATAGASRSAVNLDSQTDEELKRLGQDLAEYADEEATRLGTMGDCAHGPRLAFARAGLVFSPAVATEQGEAVRNSGMFDEVTREQVRPGDYGVRNWSASVVSDNKGIDKGDSFIVTKIDSDGRVEAANDHHFTVPEDGERYRNLRFYRLNENFLRLNAFANRIDA
jgi:hypothetical protein